MAEEDHLPAVAADGPWPPGWTVRHVAETGSTNADLVEVADRTPDRSVLVAGHQTAGRGRLDRRWEAPPGTNLLVSLLFHSVPADAGDLTRRVGLACVAAVRRLFARHATLKWPNDVLLDDRKLGGILAQRAPGGAVVVGLGLNVGWCPPGAIALGGPHRPVDVLAAILDEFDTLPADVHDRYREHLSTLGRRVRIELPVGQLAGTAIDVERDGRLIVVDECAVTHRIDVGDVVHLRTT